MKLFLIIVLLCLLFERTLCYNNNHNHVLRRYSHTLNAKSKSGGVGFGKKETIEENESSSTSISPSTSSSTSSSIKVMDNMLNEGDSSIPMTITSTSNIDKSAIAKTLSSSPKSPEEIEKQILSTKMFKDQRNQKISELDDKIRRLREEEELIASDPSVGAVPELVANRMITRIAGFFGIPVFGGLSIFVGAFFYSKNSDSIIPPYIIAYATQVPFVLGLIGISYAILSSSWDEDKEGSLLGIDEIKINLKRIQDGFGRVQETERLKEDIEKDINKLGRKK